MSDCISWGWNDRAQTTRPIVRTWKENTLKTNCRHKGNFSSHTIEEPFSNLVERLENINLCVHVHRWEKMVCPRIRYWFYFCCWSKSNFILALFCSWEDSSPSWEWRHSCTLPKQEVGQSYKLSLSRLHLLDSVSREPSVHIHDPIGMNILHSSLKY